MKRISLENQALITAGTFCEGFGAVVLVYEVGVLANFWNPIGWGGQAALVAVGAYCYFKK